MYVRLRRSLKSTAVSAFPPFFSFPFLDSIITLVSFKLIRHWPRVTWKKVAVFFFLHPVVTRSRKNDHWFVVFRFDWSFTPIQTQQWLIWRSNVSFLYMYVIIKTFYMEQILIGISRGEKLFCCCKDLIQLVYLDWMEQIQATKYLFDIYRVLADWRNCKGSLITIRGNQGGFITQYLQERNGT